MSNNLLEAIKNVFVNGRFNLLHKKLGNYSCLVSFHNQINPLISNLFQTLKYYIKINSI